MHTRRHKTFQRFAGAMLAVVCAGSAACPASADSLVTVQVSPRVCLAECNARITVHIEADNENRALIIEVDSPAFSRRSTIQLSGAEGPRVHTLRLRALPSATYVIRATLMRLDEEMRATPMKLLVTGRDEAEPARTRRG